MHADILMASQALINKNTQLQTLISNWTSFLMFTLHNPSSRTTKIKLYKKHDFQIDVEKRFVNIHCRTISLGGFHI